MKTTTGVVRNFGQSMKHIEYIFLQNFEYQLHVAASGLPSWIQYNKSDLKSDEKNQ